jgi:hypothetical protein
MPVPLPGTDHVAKIAIGFVRNPSQLENILHVRDTTDAIFADPVGFLDSVAGFVVSDIMPHMFNDILFNSLGFEDVRTVPFGGLTIGAPTPTAGTLTQTGNYPNSVTLAIKKETGNLGRSGRGRLYWPSMDQSVCSDDNTCGATYASAIKGALLTLQGHIESIHSGISVGVVSYFLDKVLRSAGLFMPITAWSTTDLTLDNQRRRLPGRGR